MSSFICEFCGKEIIDSPKGYITECEHYPKGGNLVYKKEENENE
jgi:hypothetical protein